MHVSELSRLTHWGVLQVGGSDPVHHSQETWNAEVAYVDHHVTDF